MRIRTMLLLGLVVVDLSVVEKAIEVDNALDCVELQAQVELPRNLAPESMTRRFNQWRFCLLCGETMDVIKVERHEKSTVFGLCEVCWERKNRGESVVKMSREEITARVYCKVCKVRLRVIKLHPRFEPEQYDLCKSCQIKGNGKGVARVVCPACDRVHDYEATEPERNGAIRLSVCPRCEGEYEKEEEPVKKLSDLEQFKLRLKEWEPKQGTSCTPVETAI